MSMNNTIKIGLLLIVAAIVGVPTATAGPSDPYPLYGYVVYENGTPVGAGANVTFTNMATGEVIYDLTSASGSYMDDAANFPSGYQDGQMITYYTVFGEYTNTTSHTIDVATGSCNINITVSTSSTGTDVQPPTNLQHTTGNFWVRHTWTGGAHTDSYNVSINGVWHNGTTNTYYNHTGMSAHGWSNITVAGYNATTGNTSTSISADVQIPNNPITITNTGDWDGEVGDTVSVDYDATDADSDTPTFSCSRTDLFTDFNTATGTGSWTPSSYGTTSVDFGVSDGHGSTSNYTMTITVTHFSIKLTAKKSGTEANSIVTTETGANTSFSAPTLTGGSDTDLSGDWADEDAPTGSNLWGNVGGMINMALVIGIVGIIMTLLRRGMQ